MGRSTLLYSQTPRRAQKKGPSGDRIMRAVRADARLTCKKLRHGSQYVLFFPLSENSIARASIFQVTRHRHARALGFNFIVAYGAK